MGATYLGAVSVGGETVGLTAQFSTIGTALASASSVLNAQAAAAASVNAAASALLSALATARAAIRAAAIVDFQAAIDGSVALSAQLTGFLSDPAGYLVQLEAGAALVVASLPTLDASIGIGAQLDAQAGIQVAAQAKIDAVDAAMAGLDSIAASITAVVDAAADLQAALSAAYTATLTPLAGWASLTTKLDATGAYAFLYDGALSGLGAAIDAVTPSAGIGGGVSVRVPLVFVQTADTPAIDGINAVFKTS